MKPYLLERECIRVERRVGIPTIPAKGEKAEY
jgi:hypothetical protein